MVIAGKDEQRAFKWGRGGVHGTQYGLLENVTQPDIFHKVMAILNANDTT